MTSTLDGGDGLDSPLVASRRHQDVDESTPVADAASPAAEAERAVVMTTTTTTGHDEPNASDDDDTDEQKLVIDSTALHSDGDDETTC